MRSVTLGLGLVAVLLVAGSASADGDTDGSSAPATVLVPTPEPSAVTAPAPAPSPVVADKPAAAAAPATPYRKPWEVNVSWETHRLMRQEDLNGSGPNKLFNVLGVTGQYDITQNDRVRIGAYMYQRFMVDSGETGFRFDDMILQYIRRIPLPEQFTLRAGGWVTLPTSFSSEKASMITAPRVYLDLQKQFGNYVTANLRGSAGAFIFKYRASEGGAYNPKYSTRIGAEVEVVMPFHKALSFGAGAGTGWTWFYDPSSAADGNLSAQQYGSVADPTFQQQPILQSYNAELYGRYQLPTVVGFNSDMVLSAANGDPSLGFQSVLHDGVGRFYVFHRSTAQVYAVLSVRY